MVERLWQERAIAILRTSDRDRAGVAMEAAIEGGFRVCEFTLGTPGALDLVREFSEDDRLVVGVGTVLTVEDARAAVAAGARFLVSPVVDEAVVAVATELGVASLPGAVTPTELWRAWRAGATFCKLFPAPSPEIVRTILGPMPFLRLVPTSGADLGNAAAYLEAGAFALGFVRPLFDPVWVASGDRTAIRERARALLEAVRGPVRSAAPPAS
jgi:2-dehydro-3-deoxyphosphogluconate aldolase / (4S)-4-hydroxy-2-oxoglutarate aldolase